MSAQAEQQAVQPEQQAVQSDQVNIQFPPMPDRVGEDQDEEIMAAEREARQAGQPTKLGCVHCRREYATEAAWIRCDKAHPNLIFFLCEEHSPPTPGRPGVPSNITPGDPNCRCLQMYCSFENFYQHYNINHGWDSIDDLLKRSDCGKDNFFCGFCVKKKKYPRAIPDDTQATTDRNMRIRQRHILKHYRDGAKSKKWFFPPLMDTPRSNRR
ncbi:uncharacterized protein BDZ83DRAFT_653924 [Colletotrichum acutatum]|uniref:Uncharacterized protein n=1 Tax=Glomerella acutata TaxID=27357 RepID=A0AAD8UIQ1_GLOAC|nr:uncharacterized protein BDZ83DRAFT_653924 [Colletotrichum acutatum]KAK1722449.1 hypothetical protein BDZ83DRAFT_653924 [Colletotrichum acutatum]